MAISVMAVHGNGGGGDRFRWMAPHLPTDIHLHAPTLPGFGGKPMDPRTTDMAGYARTLLGDLLSMPRPRVVLGTGIGGSWVLELLRDHAAEVDGVILHAPVGPRLDTRLFPKVMRRPAVAEAVRRIIANQWARPLIARRFFAPDTPENRVDSVLNAYAQCSAFAQQFQIITAEWWRSLPAMSVPSVVLWGAEERVLAADMAEDVRQVLPDADIQTVPGWDHFPMIDTPEHYAEVIARAARALVATARPAG
jgi:pimeloyl-ACP methyl ester carboxylesterase